MMARAKRDACAMVALFLAVLPVVLMLDHLPARGDGPAALLSVEPGAATPAEIEDVERWLRDAYEVQRKAAQDASDDDARQAWLLRRRMVEAAISARELQNDLLEGPPVVDPPEPPGGLPARDVLEDRHKNASGRDYELHGAAGYPILIEEAGAFAFRNGVVSAPGSDGDWRHGSYATRGSVTIEDHWFYAPTREEQLGRDHLVIYASGCPSVVLRRVMIGHPDDEHAHDLAIKIKSHADAADRRTGTVVIEDVVVFGGRRVLVSIENDEADRGVLSAESVVIRRLLWVDPDGDDGGRIEGIRLDGVGEVTIDELVVIDTRDRITKPVLVSADETVGTVHARVYLPASLGDRELVEGLEHEVEVMARPPPGERPEVYGPEHVGAWLAWAGMIDDAGKVPKADKPDRTLWIEQHIARQVELGRGVVYLPHGDVSIQRGIVIPPSIREVRGRGTRLHVPTHPRFNAIRVEGSGGCLLTGFAVIEDGERAAGDAAGGAALAIRDCDGVTVRDVLIEGTGGLVVQRSTGTLLEGVRVEGSWSYGVQLLESEGWTLRDCRVSDAWRDGYKINGGSGRGLMDGCAASGCGRSWDYLDAGGKPVGNGDGVDLMVGGHHVTIAHFEGRNNNGSSINIKTGMLDVRAGTPVEFVTVVEPRSTGELLHGVHINSENNRDVSRSRYVSVVGGQYEALGGNAVRVSRGELGALSGVLLVRGVEEPVYVHPDSTDFYDDSRVVVLEPAAPTGTIGWYNFGGSGRVDEPGQNRRLIQAGSWQAWAEATLAELPAGVTRVWLHNPFGLYYKDGDDGRGMWIDQWVLAQGVLPAALTDVAGFVEGVAILRTGGVTEVVAYVGSPTTLDDQSYAHVETLLRPMLASGCSIAFDATYDWRKGDDTDRLIQAIRSRGHRVYVEPWLLADREYGAFDGIVHMDRFLPRETIGGVAMAELDGVEQVIIQLRDDAAKLKADRDAGATIAVRLWTVVGREVVE